MNVGQTFLIVSAAMCLVGASAVAVVAFARFRRGGVVARSSETLAPYRQGLIVVASGEDDDGAAKALLRGVEASTWALLRPSVVAFLPKVRGQPAEDLVEVMRAHGELDRATRRLTSRSAVRRARGAYLLGLVGDRRGAALVLPLLSDPVPDVRLVAAQALGAIGDPLAATSVLHALSAQPGQLGLPPWVAAEALLAMGVEIGPILQIGLASDDAAVRNVCALVAGHGTYLSAAPQLRVLLARDSDCDVRVSAAVALGRVGGAQDVATLAEHTSASEPTALRRTCVTALGDLGQQESMDALVGLLADDDRRLAELAADSLVRIGDKGIALLEVAAATLHGPSAMAAGAALELEATRERLTLSETGS